MNDRLDTFSFLKTYLYMYLEPVLNRNDFNVIVEHFISVKVGNRSWQKVSTGIHHHDNNRYWYQFFSQCFWFVHLFFLRLKMFMLNMVLLWYWEISAKMQWWWRNKKIDIGQILILHRCCKMKKVVLKTNTYGVEIWPSGSWAWSTMPTFTCLQISLFYFNLGLR